MTAYYTCEGRVRPDCGVEHRTREAAERCCETDTRWCRSQGGYSDRVVVHYDDDGARRTEGDLDDAE